MHLEVILRQADHKFSGIVQRDRQGFSATVSWLPRITLLEFHDDQIRVTAISDSSGASVHTMHKELNGKLSSLQYYGKCHRT
jgi:hypothetical protein